MDKIGKEELYRLLQREIDWCLDNPSEELTQDQQMGFMNGIRHVQLLIRLLDDHVHQWIESDTSFTGYRCSHCANVRPDSLSW
jgi:hypothetical protein